MNELRKETGAVMIEATIVMVITLLLLVWVLGLGFLHYQRYVVTIVTNDAAAKVAATYDDPNSDIIMGYVSSGSFAQRNLYRSTQPDSLLAANQGKAEAYVDYILKKSNFAGTIESVEVDVKLVSDTMLRSHVEVTTSCTFNTPFGVALKFFGMDDIVTYSSTARCDSTELMDYVDTTDFIANFGSLSWTGSKAVKMVNSFLKLVYSHNYAKS